jgi:hypothetical protein
LGVAVDQSGNVFVTDTGNNTIRRITPARVVTTLGGLALIVSADGQLGTVARADTGYVAGRSDAKASVNAQAGIVAARRVIEKRSFTDRRVVVASGVRSERKSTVGRVEVADRVVLERLNTSGSIVAAVAVVLECPDTVSRVSPPTVLLWSAKTPVAVLAGP